jgi:hypothetical protein
VTHGEENVPAEIRHHGSREGLRQAAPMAACWAAGKPFPLAASAPEEIRTPNLLIRSQMLYPLSYGRICSVI